ncbi:MAG: hypothetical protein H8E58_11030 [SAR92 clade bacterium]|nr:hypothetical protein [SAR92 clade bacterium]
MMKEIMTAFNILLVALLLVGCTTPGSSSRPQKDWLFAHITWLDGISRQEVKVVVTGAKISAKDKSITYTTEAMTDMDGIIAVASPHLYLDRY